MRACRRAGNAGQYLPHAIGRPDATVGTATIHTLMEVS